MGADTKGKGITETIAEEAKGVAVEVYKDAAKPALSQVGQTLGVAVKVALAPVNLILHGLDAATTRLSAAVERKLAGVPADRILPPPATIAAPAVLQYALLGAGDDVADLRELFENLLAASMDRDTAADAHPAFVSMISQLTPDEAKILRSIDRDVYALLRVYQHSPDDEGYHDRNGPTLAVRTHLGKGMRIDQTRLRRYFSNLERLGVLRIEQRAAPNGDEYDELVAGLETEFPHADAYNANDRIEVTPLGRQFLDTCVRPRTR